MTQNLFAIIAYDAEDTSEARQAHRDGHLAHFKTHAASILVSGPLSNGVAGSLIIYAAPSSEAARTFIETDPFFEAGVWSRIEVASFKAAMGQWVA